MTLLKTYPIPKFITVLSYRYSAPLGLEKEIKNIILSFFDTIGYIYSRRNGKTSTLGMCEEESGRPAVLDQLLTGIEKMLGRLIGVDIELLTIQESALWQLFWKMMKKFLYEIHGVESVSPKMAMKQLYRIQYANEKNYETLIEMINDRNRLSHVYTEEQFIEIYSRIKEYLKLMRVIVNEVTGTTRTDRQR